jgi:tyrosine-protein phosphatase SIW14
MKSTSSALLLTLVILTLTGVPLGAQPGQAVSKKDIPNFGQVAPGIYRGAAPTAAGLKKLKEMGVKTIIDLRIEKKGQPEETSVAKQLGLNRIRIPMGREAPTKTQVETFLKAMEASKDTPVFVHCQHGADRTGAMVGIYRVTKQGWTFDQAWKEMRKYGFKTFLWELKGSVKSRAKS